MALVRCPECGRENVSDSAEVCPTCGYGVKAHYEREREQADLFRRKFSEAEIPQKPTGTITAASLLFVFAGFTFLLMLLDSNFNVLGIIFGGLCLFCAIGLIFVYNDEMAEYERKCKLAKDDPEKYRREVYAEVKREMEIENEKPKCPNCKSTNIEKIKTVDRAVSVATLGLASGKIGKQYRCKSCKHMW